MKSQKALADRLFPIRKQSDDDDHGLLNVPPEQRKLHTENVDLSVSTLHMYMQNNKIEVPEFQRGYVWTRTQASRLIESLIIQCPIPVIYFSQTDDNRLVVVDGNQRLLSIKLFLENAFALQGLSAYPELNNNKWTDLDPRFRDHINNRTIRCIIILKETHPQIKFDVFERLNTGSIKLNSQELRHGLHYGYLMKSIDTLSRDKYWVSVTGLKHDKRMKGSELILRFMAFHEDLDRYHKPLSSFLDTYSSKAKGYDNTKVDSLVNQFRGTLLRVESCLGSLAFRLYSSSLKPEGQFNSALFDAQMIGFSNTQNRKIRNTSANKKQLQLHVAKLFKNDDFLSSIKQATSDETNVQTRTRLFLDCLNNF